MYCIYLRKSRKDNELESVEDTLARHEKALVDLAKRQKITVTNIYKEVVSGESISARPVMQQLLNEVEQGLWQGVLVMEVERLARGNTLDQGIMAQAFQISNTKIITPLKIYDPNNEYDEEYFEFGLFMSRREYKTINRRIQRGRITSIHEGKYISPVAPFGYDRIKLEGTKGYTLEPNENAQVVRLIFDLYTNENIGSYRIAQQLNKLCYKPMKSEKWSGYMVTGILLNPTYTGKVKWGERAEVKSISNGEVTKTRPFADSFILVDGIHEAIISDEQFEKAQEIRKRNIKNRVPQNKELQSPLAGIIYCKFCGKAMQRQVLNKKDRKQQIRLVCSTQGCECVSSRFDIVENKILEALKELQHQLEIEPIEEREEIDHIPRLLKEKTEVEAQIKKVHEFLEKGVYSIDTFLERNKSLSEQLKSIGDTITLLSQKKPVKTQDFAPKLSNLIEVYETTKSVEEKNTLLKEVVAKIEYAKNQKGKGLENAFALEIYPTIEY